MEDKLIMEVYVQTEDKLELDGPAGKIIMIPFSGTIKSAIFNGEILAGGVDRQIIDVNGLKHMSARYMAEGVDHTGKACKLFIENDGYFTEDSPRPFRTIPTFYTDSDVLAEYLHRNAFRGEGHVNETGVTIKIFEV